MSFRRSVGRARRAPGRVRQARACVKELRGLLLRVGRGVGQLGALAGGLGGTYRWCRRAMLAAYERGGDAAFADWRVAVRYHRFHVRLLATQWPQEFEGRRQVLDRLAALLHEDHELERLRERGRLDEPRAGLADERRRALRAMARPLGRWLFNAPPPLWQQSLKDCWRQSRNPAGLRAAAA